MKSYFDTDHNQIIEFDKNFSNILVGEWDVTSLFVVFCVSGYANWIPCMLRDKHAICHGDSILIMGTTVENLWFNFTDT